MSFGRTVIRFAWQAARFALLNTLVMNDSADSCRANIAVAVILISGVAFTRLLIIISLTSLEKLFFGIIVLTLFWYFLISCNHFILFLRFLLGILVGNCVFGSLPPPAFLLGRRLALAIFLLPFFLVFSSVFVVHFVLCSCAAAFVRCCVRALLRSCAAAFVHCCVRALRSCAAAFVCCVSVLLRSCAVAPQLSHYSAFFVHSCCSCALHCWCVQSLHCSASFVCSCCSCSLLQPSHCSALFHALLLVHSPTHFFAMYNCTSMSLVVRAAAIEATWQQRRSSIASH